MSRATHLASRIERTVTGPMWHGPALIDLLAGGTAGLGRQRPVAGAHSIWELVLHVTVWCDIARQRITGQAIGDPTPDEDWPPVPAPEAATASDHTSGSDADPPDPAWTRAVERLRESHRHLAADVRLLDDGRLNALVPGLEYSVSVMLNGVVEHGAYHAGQIALLTRAGGQP